MKYFQELVKEQTLSGVAGTFGMMKQFGPEFRLGSLFFFLTFLLTHFQVEQPEIPGLPVVQKISPSNDLV